MSKPKSLDTANYLVTTEDLGSILHPFFKRSFGRLLGKGLLSLLKVNEINRIHATHCHLKGKAVTQALLSDSRIDVSYKLHNPEYLDAMRESGAFFTISNHPFGGLDGIILIDIMAEVRQDFKVLVNGFLNRITALNDFWIPVQPRVNRKNYIHDPSKNIFGVRMVAQQIMEGRPVGMFPAGGLPHYSEEYRQPVEQLWQMNNVKIMKAAQVPIFPIMFEGNNSHCYYNFGRRFGYAATSLLLPREIINKRGKQIDVYLGAPIMPEEMASTRDLKSARSLVMHRSLSLLPSYQTVLATFK